MKSKQPKTLVFLELFLVVAVIGLVSNMVVQGITGFNTEDVETSTSQVVIQKYVSAAKSNALSDGINFGNLSTLPVTHQNATANYNATETNFNITVSSDSNVAMDFCIKANAGLETTGGASIIGLPNYTWSGSATNDEGNPAVPGVSLTTSYVAADTNIAGGSAENFRFWLNVSATTPAGTYNNTLYFKGLPTGDSCT